MLVDQLDPAECRPIRIRPEDKDLVRLEEFCRNLQQGEAVSVRLQFPIRHYLFVVVERLVGTRIGSAGVFDRLVRIVRAEVSEDIRVFGVYPSIENPRFFFPYDAKAIHLFLLRDVLLPRRYALKFKERVLQRLFMWAVRVIPASRFLCRSVLVVAQK